MAITPRDCVPKDWTLLLGNGPLGLGLDLATTEKDTSNPSSLTVTEQDGPLYITRLVILFKTSREEVTRAICKVVLEDIQRAQKRARRLCVDASNERFFAQQLAKQLSLFCPVELVINSENKTYKGEVFDTKTLLMNLYLNSFTDARMRLPGGKWLADDHRLMKKRAGRFVSDLSPAGNHADTVSSGMLARWALEGSGKAEIAGVPVGNFGQGKQLPAGLKNPLLKQLKRNTTHA
jgi:hypothetical protein